MHDQPVKGCSSRIRFELVAINGEVVRTPHAEDMRVWLVSGNIRRRIGAPMRRAQPFLIGGVGVTRWESDVLQDSPVTDFTTNVVGLGYAGQSRAAEGE